MSTTMPFFIRALAVALALTTLTPLAAAETLSADLVHSRAEFHVTHLLLSKVWGHVPFRSLQLVPAHGSVPFESVDVVLDLSHEDTDNPTRDADLRSRTYLDTETYPNIVFKSTRIYRDAGAAKDTFTIAGDLTLHGVTKPVKLAAHDEGKVPENGGWRVGYTAGTTIDRRDFGITSAMLTPAGIPLVGNDVEIALTVEATTPRLQPALSRFDSLRTTACIEKRDPR